MLSMVSPPKARAQSPDQETGAQQEVGVDVSGTKRIARKVVADHGIVCALPKERYGYFGWPSIARTDDGVLFVAASGFRFDHVCPWGKSVVTQSKDNGQTWSHPRVVNNSPLDDRDCGLLSLGGNKLLLSWFSSDIRRHYEWARNAYGLSDEEQKRWEDVFATWSDEVVEKWKGSWIRTSVDGEAWGDPVRLPVSAPHGPIRLRSGRLFYLGKGYFVPGKEVPKYVGAVVSDDEAKTWVEAGRVPFPDDSDPDHFCEPHAVELPSGKIIGLLRYVNNEHGRYSNFSMFQTESSDGGETWSTAKYLGVKGSPPHLVRHSTGALVCVYSYRMEPLGNRAMISWDDGATWESDWILEDQAPPRDHGYPASVELPDGRLFTVSYQRTSVEDKNCGLVWTLWDLPDRAES